jgi:allantoin racemase
MSAENLGQRRDQLKAAALGPDVAFDFEPVTVATKHHVSASDMAVAEFGILVAGLATERRGHDAVCVDTVSDSGVSALMFGNRFSILAMWPHWRHLYTRTLTDPGLAEKCASIRWIDATPDNQGLLSGKEDQVFPAHAVARRCIAEDGAEGILPGSTAMHQAHAHLAAWLPVPVISPGPLSCKLAEAALGPGLTRSRAAWPAGSAPRQAVIHAMAEAGTKAG